jgi:hypothetical protein
MTKIKVPSLGPQSQDSSAKVPNQAPRITGQTARVDPPKGDPIQPDMGAGKFPEKRPGKRIFPRRLRAFPSPLWGGVRGGGREANHKRRRIHATPLNPPLQGEGRAPTVRGVGPSSRPLAK